MEIETISMDTFKTLGNQMLKASPQLKAVRAMEPNTAVIMSHEGLKCKKTKKGQMSCSFRSIVTVVQRKHSDRMWAVRHLPDGRVAVACFPVDNKDDPS